MILNLSWNSTYANVNHARYIGKGYHIKFKLILTVSSFQIILDI